MEDEISFDMRQARINQLKTLLQDIADLEWQQKVWVENSIPDIFSSWEEIMCQFFDDTDVDELLNKNDPKFNLSQNQLKSLSNLRDLMKNYSDSTPQFMCPKEVLKDPQWLRISQYALITSKEFENHKL